MKFSWNPWGNLPPMSGRTSAPDDNGLLAYEPEQRWHFQPNQARPEQAFPRIADPIEDEPRVLRIPRRKS